MAEKTNNGLLWAIGIVLIILGIIYFSGAGAPGGVIKIGVVIPLTGEMADRGTVMQQAYHLAAGEINAEGGLRGREIELIFEDGMCDADVASEVTAKLLIDDQVEYILGGTCSTEVLAIAELTQTARVLLLSPSSTSPAVTQAGDLVYRMLPSDVVEATLVADHAVKDENLRAAIISEDTDVAQEIRAAFTEAYKGEIVFDEMFVGEVEDLRLLVSQMRSTNPQMVYVIPGTSEVGELILEQMETAYFNVAVYGASSMLDRDAFTEKASLYEEMILAEVQLADGKAAAMLAAYSEAYEEAPAYTTLAASAYDSIYLLAAAFTSGARSPEGVAEFFDNKIVDWEGTLGTLNFDENGDSEIELVLVQVIGGEVVVLGEKKEETTE